MNSKQLRPTGKVFIVGTGMVGSSCAYALLSESSVSEIFLLDINESLRDAQVYDLQHAASVDGRVIVSTGDYSDIADGDILVITAGLASLKNKTGENQTRLDLAEKNIAIVGDIMARAEAGGAQFYTLVVTNPVDVLTYKLQQQSKLPAELIFGSGTYLDSLRLQFVLSTKLSISPAQVRAYVFGEHGDSSFPALSGATINNIPLDMHLDGIHESKTLLAKEVQEAAYKIIEGKGSTYFGIASAVKQIIDAILHDTGAVIPLSVNPEGKYGLGDELAIGLPAKVGKHGAKVFDHYPLSSEEGMQLQQSADIIKSILLRFN